MAIKSWAFALVAFALLALATPSSASRKLLTDECDDECHMNTVLASAYLKANYFHCAAYGRPIDAEYCGGGPAPDGCFKATLSQEAQDHAEKMAKDTIHHIIKLRKALGVHAKPQPAINIQANIRLILKASINAIIDVDVFDCYADDKQFYLGAFIVANLHLNIQLAVQHLVKLKVYVNLLVSIIPTCQHHVRQIRDALLVWADVKLFLLIEKCPTIEVIVQLCIQYLDCGLASVLGVNVDVILSPLVKLFLKVDLSVLVVVLVKLVGILKVCVFL